MSRNNFYYQFISFIICMLCGNIYVNAQVIENPVFDRTDVPEYRVEKVECTKDTTYVYCTYVAEAGSWANMSKDTYLRDVKTNKTYPLIKCEGLPYTPDRKNFAYKEMCNIRLSFRSVQNISKFDLIEDPKHKSFNVYGIDINNHYKETYDELKMNRLLTLSSFYDSSGDTLKSIQYKKELFEAQRYYYGRLSDVTFFSLLGLCVLYDKFGFHHEVINQIQTLSMLHNESWGDYSLEDAVLRRVFAEDYILINYYDMIVETIKNAIDVYEKYQIIDNVYAFLLRNNAESYHLYNDEDNFVKELKKCIEIRKNLGDERYYLEELLILLTRNANPNNNEERLNLVETELESIPSFVNTKTLDYVYFLKYLALLNALVNRYKKANEICDQMITILKENERCNILRIAEVMGEKCSYLKELGFTQEAIDTGRKAIELYDSINYKQNNYKQILDDLASMYNALFDYEKSILIVKQIAELYEKEEDWLALTKSLCSIGINYMNAGDLDKAGDYIKKALNVISHHDKAEEYLEKEINANPEAAGGNLYDNLKYYNEMILSLKAIIYGSLGFVASDKGEFEEAIKNEHKAGEIMKLQIANCTEVKLRLNQANIEYALHLLSLSNYYFRNSQYDESNECAKESIEYFQKGGVDYCKSYERLALNKFLMNDVDSAIYYANEALSISNAFGNKERKQTCMAMLALFYPYINKFQKAEECLSSAIDNVQSKIRRDIVGMTNKQKQRLWSLNEYMFLNYRRIITKCVWSMPLISKLYNYTIFSKSLLMDTDSPDDELSLKKMGTTWKDIQKRISFQDIAIEFITTQEDSIHKAYHALVIDSNCDNPIMITLFNDSVLEIIKQKNMKSELEILGNLLWKPILDQYGQIKNIYFSPDGMLHVIPIEHCLVDGIGEIADHYNLYRLSSTKELIFQVKDSTMNNATLYGGLDYDLLAKESKTISDEKKRSLLRGINERGGFDPLLSTLEEVNEINNLFNQEKIPTKLYTGDRGTEDSFKDLSGKDVSILHLSTHGMYVEPNNVKQKKSENNFDFLELITNENDPVKEDIVLTHSFLVMSGGNKLSHRETLGTTNDGILTAFEISHVDLSKVDLVVLSACETGLGDIENGGVYGLQRGFKKAGAKTILMSLNKVDDEATKILMVEFYRNLMDGKTKHQSLKDAQKYLRQVENGKYNKPEYWASFILLDGFE